MSSPSTYLVFNGGSSSIKFSVFSEESKALLYEGVARDIGAVNSELKVYRFDGEERTEVREKEISLSVVSFEDAVTKIIKFLEQVKLPPPLAIGHRVVHSGPNLKSHQWITPEVLRKIEASVPLAPIHQPIAIKLIKELYSHFPNVKNFACFDTVFHQSIPAVASTYPVPMDLQENGVRRYGFHGISCESILSKFQSLPTRMVIAHLGSGASVTAVNRGQSIDTTMGLTPSGGILMGTRSGDLDPGLIFYLLRYYGTASNSSIEIVEKLLNEDSGVLALSKNVGDSGGFSDPFAAEVFSLGVKKVIGGFIALLGGLDALVFTGGIGENLPQIRSQICQGMNPFGFNLDNSRNLNPKSNRGIISKDSSLVGIHVLPSEENRVILNHMLKQKIEPINS